MLIVDGTLVPTRDHTVAEASIADLAAKLDHFPEHLDPEQRAEYVLGEAHQKVAGLSL